MSILIKMEMPKNCEECNLESFCDLWVDAKRMCGDGFTDSKARVKATIRHPNCPLIEQKTGKWIDKWYCSDMSGYEYAMKCSECGKPTYRISFAEPMPNYCPNCGARMVEI